MVCGAPVPVARGVVARGSIREGTLREATLREGTLREGSMREASKAPEPDARVLNARGHVAPGSMREGTLHEGTLREGSMREGTKREGSKREASMREALGARHSILHKRRRVGGVQAQRTQKLLGEWVGEGRRGTPLCVDVRPASHDVLVAKYAEDAVNLTANQPREQLLFTCAPCNCARERCRASGLRASR